MSAIGLVVFLHEDGFLFLAEEVARTVLTFAFVDDGLVVAGKHTA